jgi:hypothetical protein
LLLAGATSCSAGEDERGVSICDGSSDIRFAAKWIPLGLISESEFFRSELGSRYVYVSGECDYWVLTQPEGKLDRTHAGRLSPDEADELADDVGYDEFSTLEGVYVEQGAADGSAALFYDGRDVIACYGSCPESPEGVQSARDSLTPWIERLWDQGAEYDGAVRLVVNRLDRFDTAVWPLAWPLNSIEYQPGVPAESRSYVIGSSSLVADHDDALQLRDLWRAQQAPDAVEVALAVSDPAHDDGTFDVWSRDSLPFEDARGLFFIPSPCSADYDCVADATCVDAWCREARD